MPDLYSNFAELAANEVEGEDYTISTNEVPGAMVVIFAPHGGSIESGCSEMVDYVAEEENYSSYKFDGIKNGGNFDLHITSTNFDEPQAEELIRKTYHTLSFHGYTDDDNNLTYIGGLDMAMRLRIESELTRAGFSASNTPPDHISGETTTNITNKNMRIQGVQLELSTSQRRAFFRDNDYSSSNRQYKTQLFYDYCRAIIRALDKGYKYAPLRLRGPSRILNLTSKRG